MSGSGASITNGHAQEQDLLEYGPLKDQATTDGTFNPNTRIVLEKQECWGGAVTVTLPSTFRSLSDIVPIGDTQELFSDILSPITVNLDILDRVQADPQTNPTEQDNEAFKVHLDEVLAEHDREGNRIPGAEGEVKILESRSIDPDVSTGKNTNRLALTAVQVRNTSSSANLPRSGIWDNNPDFVILHMGLIRYKPAQNPDATADFVVTVSVPHYPGQYRAEDVDRDAGRFDTLLCRKGRLISDYVLRSFEIVDDSFLGG